ncbi:Cap15 family cyclic dinucleotide receptor domain-containing protein [Acinetobacter sp. ANC 4636]
MNFIVLTFEELKKVIYIFLGIGIICFFILNLPFLEKYNLSIIQMVSTSITISFFILGILLTSIIFKNKILSKIIGKPIVHGLWKGELQSNYQIGGKQIPPIEIYFYIKQTFLFTTIKSFTSNQKSESVIAALSYDSTAEKIKFLYTYTLYRTKNSENKMTFGSGDLSLINNSNKLVGIYWTNENTRGEIELKLIDRDCNSIDSFEMACFHYKKICSSGNI